MIAAAKKIWRVFRSAGAAGLYRRVLWKKYLYEWNKVYQRWIAEFDTITNEDRAWIRRQIEGFESKPLISVLMPVYNVDERWLRKAIESVTAQTYSNWEFCIADDHSPAPHVRRVLDEYAAADDRIKVVYRERNGHISAASNSALELVTGEFTALLDHDDELSEHALFRVAEALDKRPKIDMIYSDEDLIDSSGRRYFPKFKPDWSPDLFYSMNMVTHLSVYRTSILKKIGGFRLGIEGSQDYDLALRFTEEIDPGNIHHIPEVLYHWRAISGSVALASEEKPYAHARARQALNEHFERTGIAAGAHAGFGELHRTIYQLAGPRPMVSLIVTANGDAAASVKDLAASYGPLELIIAGADTIERTSERTMAGGTSECFAVSAKPRFAMLNEAAAAASGQILCFLEASTAAASANWLNELVGIAMQTGIGAVGGKVVFPNGRIKNAGLIMGIGEGVGRSHYGFHKDDLGNFMRMHVTQNYSAVSAECLVIRREVFESAAGFDAENFPEQYADADLCLRLLEQGFRNVWTPWAEVVQMGHPGGNAEDELERLRSRWARVFAMDPYYNPNFSSKDAAFDLAFPPRRCVFGREAERAKSE